MSTDYEQEKDTTPPGDEKTADESKPETQTDGEDKAEPSKNEH